MTRLLFSGHVLIACLLALTGLSAKAIDEPVEATLTSIETKANNVVREAGSQGRGVAMEAAQGLLQSIRLFRSLYGSALTETVDKLGGERAALFRDIQNMANTLDTSAISALDRVQRAADSLAETVAQAVGSRAFPRIRTVTPLFSVAGDPTAAFSIKGLFLAHGKPSLEMQGKRRSPGTALDTELRFDNPTTAATITEPVLVPATLTVYEHIARRFWFDATEAKTYPLQLAVYPRAIGPAELTPLLRTQQTVSNTYTGPLVRCESPRGEGTASVPHSFSPTDGYTIDPASIEFVREYANNGTHSFGGTGTLTLTCHGFGKNLVDKGEVGVISGRVRFRETKTTDVVVLGTAIPFIFSWGDSRVEQLPANAVGVKFALTPTFTRQRLESVGSSRIRFAAVEFDPVAKTVRVTAAPIDVALREP